MIAGARSARISRDVIQRFSQDPQDISDHYRNPFRFIVLSFTVLTVMIANGAPTI